MNAEKEAFRLGRREDAAAYHGSQKRDPDEGVPGQDRERQGSELPGVGDQPPGAFDRVRRRPVMAAVEKAPGLG